MALSADTWCFAYCNIPNDRQAIAAAIKRRSTIAVSDGSYKNQYGTAAVIIEGDTSLHRIIAKVITPGGAQDHSSYRSETLTIINHLCAFHNIHEHQVFSNNSTSSDVAVFDLVSAARKAWLTSLVNWITRHVEGHKDKDPMHRLDCWESLNVEADNLARDFLAIARNKPRHNRLSLEPWSIWYQGQKVLNIKQSVYDIVHSSAAREYWRAKDKVHKDTIDLVDWEVVQKALKEVPRLRKNFIIKHTMGMCGVGKFMKLWKKGKQTNVLDVGSLKTLAMYDLRPVGCPIQLEYSLTRLRPLDGVRTDRPRHKRNYHPQLIKLAYRSPTPQPTKWDNPPTTK
jgi:hypothetical protein